MKKEQKDKKRLAFYVRNSTDQQEYEYQINALRDTLATRNDLELVHIYAEKISGFKSEVDRPEMNELLNAVKSGEIDEIWVNEFTRLSRSALNLQSIVQECADNSVNVYFKNQALNSLDQNGKLNGITKLIIGILAQFAEMDAQNFKQKGIEGKTTKVLQGQYTGGTLPLGYSYINDINNKTKRICVEDGQKEVVEYIFNSYVKEGKSLIRIANDLNNLKLINPQFENPLKLKGRAQNSPTNYYRFQSWNPSTIRLILKCTWYALGYRLWHAEKVLLDDSLKFIDIETYQMAIESLTANYHKRKPKYGHFFLNDLLYCSCGDKMIIRRLQKRVTYMCNVNVMRFYNKSLKCEMGRSVVVNKLESAIWLYVKNKIPEFKLKVEEKTSKETEIRSNITNNAKLIGKIQNITIENLNQARKRTIYVYTNHGGDTKEFEKQLNGIDSEIKDQEKIIQELMSKNKLLELSIDNLDVASEIEKNIKLIEKDKNLVDHYLRRLIKKIVVCSGLGFSNKNVFEIFWNEGINDGRTSFLFYNSNGRAKPFYFFVSSGLDYIDISWMPECKVFRITDLNANEYIDYDFESMYDKIFELFDDWNENEYPDMQFFSYFLYQGNLPSSAGNPITKENFMNTPNKEIMERLSTRRSVYKFPINCGCSPLINIKSFE